MHYLRDCLTVTVFSSVVQFSQRLEGILNPVVSYQIPWTFGPEENHQKQGYGPDPLDCVTDSVAPLTGQVQQSVENTSSDELAYGPAKIDVASQVPTQCEWADFRRICRSSSREDAWLRKSKPVS
jgi:hypothetical protein